MLKALTIENFKSIERVTLPLGRVNVFVGENGSGKSNILEAIALAGAAEARKLDNEFLVSRGIRVSEPDLMRSAFKPGSEIKPIKVTATTVGESKFSYEIQNDNKPYSSWTSVVTLSGPESVNLYKSWFTDSFERSENKAEFISSALELSRQLSIVLEQIKGKKPRTPLSEISFPPMADMPRPNSCGLDNFVIYAPENTALRLFEREGQINPLGINGEGLLRLLSVYSQSNDKAPLDAIKQSLSLIGWFRDLKVISSEAGEGVEIFDRYFGKKKKSFDQRSANEGFLFLAFYFALFTTKLTPKFFAIDNVDTSLNPKLCEALMISLAALAKSHRKQVVLTTHNPALLDGLDLRDSENRLFIVYRDSNGPTRIRRFENKASVQVPKRLSELFLSGVLGGLPKGF